MVAMHKRMHAMTRHNQEQKTINASWKPFLIVALIGLGSFLGGCVVDLDVAWEGGNGVIVTEERTLESFTRVEIRNSFPVKVATSGRWHAEVTIDENLTGSVHTYVSGRTLIVEHEYTLSPSRAPVITINAPYLEEIVHSGSGTLVLIHNSAGEDLSLSLLGSGRMEFSGAADGLWATIRGSGEMILDGYVEYLDARVEGSGWLDAARLPTQEAYLSVFGSGRIDAHLSGGAATMNIDGSGTIAWSGYSSSVEYRLTGGGEIIELDPMYKKAAKKVASTTAAAQK